MSLSLIHRIEYKEEVQHIIAAEYLPSFVVESCYE